MVIGIPKKHARRGVRCEFLCSRGGEIRVTPTAENAKMRVGRWGSEQGLMRGAKIQGFSGVEIEEIVSSVKSFDPIDGRERSLKKKRTEDVIGRADDMLGLAVLLGCVWA